MKQPNSKHCFVCGVENRFGLNLKFYQTDPREVIVNCEIPDRYQGYPGVVHGGIVAAILDEVSGRALMHLGNDDWRFMYTAKMTIRYRKNVPVNEPLRIVGRALKDKPRLATAVGTIYNRAGEVLAEAETLLVDLPEETLDSADLDALGWRVYPDERDESVSS